MFPAPIILMAEDHIFRAGIGPPFATQPHHGPIELSDYAANIPLKNTDLIKGTNGIQTEKSLKF
jgi:hypothetical protein